MAVTAVRADVADDFSLIVPIIPVYQNFRVIFAFYKAKH